MKRERGTIFLKPGPEREALLNAFATVADRVDARNAAREKQPDDNRPAVRAPAVSTG
jgi:hypothetical protein